MTMISMELDDEDKYDARPMPDGKPDFPYGLRICLTEKEMEKLGLDAADAKYDGVFCGRFMARVTNCSIGEGPDGKCCRIEAQIECLSIDSEDMDDD